MLALSIRGLDASTLNQGRAGCQCSLNKDEGGQNTNGQVNKDLLLLLLK